MLNRKYTREKYNKFGKLKVIGLIIILIILSILGYYLIAMLPVILNSIVHNGRVYATQILIDEVSQIILDSDINYSNIIKVQRDENGDVITTNVDTQSVNKIKVDISKNIMEQFVNTQSYTYNLQLGTLLGNEFFIGRGKNIQMKIFPVGLVDTEIVSEFESVGINQVKHILSIVITINYNTIVPMNRSQGEVTSEFMLAETTIIGKVPQFYADLK